MEMDPNQIEHSEEICKEEINQFTEIYKEHHRKRKMAPDHHRRRRKRSIGNIFKRWIHDFFKHRINELEKQERKKERRIKKHIRAKRREALNKRLVETIQHPFGRPKTEMEKIILKKEKAINQHLNRKNRAFRILQIKQKIAKSISAVKSPEIRPKLFKIIIPSLAGFVVAYLTIYLLTNISSALISAFWGIDTTISTSVINFNSSPYSPLWTKGSVVSIFITPVIISMVISFFCLWLFLKSDRQGFITKIYLLWMIVIGQATAWGSFFGGFIRKQGVYHAINWGFHNTMISPKTMEIIFSAIAFIWLLIFGTLIKSLFILATPSATLIRNTYRPAYYHFLITLPFILGIAIIAGINAPIYNLYIFVQLGSMVLIFFPLYFENSSHQSENFRFKVKKSNLSSISVLGILILILFLFKLIFDSGINF